MRKAILTTVSILFAISVQSQVKNSGCMIHHTTEGSKEMVLENDTLKFEFKPTEYFWKVTIENKIDKSATIHWNEVSFIRNKKASKVVFDDTSRINMNDPLPDQSIPSYSEVSKEIYPSELWWESGPYPVYKKKSLRKEGDMLVRIILPIAIDGTKKNYEFSFLIKPS